ncbi:MAG TPA: kelch repeat-containing protein, partial [Polyangia bacterium]
MPATEKATFTHAGPPPVGPNAPYLQSAAFDESRKVLVVFGGVTWATSNPNPIDSQDLWQWDPATGAWARPKLGNVAPKARSGASMVFDSVRKKFVIFGGRTLAGDNFNDIWDWDPVTGVSVDRSTQGPSARSQHVMVFEKSTGKVLLFGGGFGDPSNSSALNDREGMSTALGDTWEWNPVAGAWTKFTPAVAPSARYGATMVWDAARNRAVLFGGMEKTQDGLNGIPKQDTWEWDPAASTWTNRTTSGYKPSQRYGHAMAYDSLGGTTLLVGGSDMNGLALFDLWEWNPATGAWTQRLTGSEPNLPEARLYASLVTDSERNILNLVGGLSFSATYYISETYPPKGEIWDLTPATASFTNRTLPPPTWPSVRWAHAITFCPDTGKTYIFGGLDIRNAFLDDMWEWDGSKWSQIQSDVRPAARMFAAMACDPVRKSIILYGGLNTLTGPGSVAAILGDTWEWKLETRQWSQLHPSV